MSYKKNRARLRFVPTESGIGGNEIKKPRFEPEQLLTPVAAALLIAGMMPVPPAMSLVLQLAAVLLAGWKTAVTAILELKKRRVTSAFWTLLSVLFLLLSGSFAAAGWVLIVFRVGLFAIRWLYYRKYKRLAQKLRPITERATLVDAKGNRLPALAAKLRIGDMISVKSGEEIPADCRCVSEEGQIDLLPFTGSKSLRQIKKGDPIPAGAINDGEALLCSVTATQADSTAKRIHDMLYHLPQEAGTISGIPVKLIKWLTPISCLIGVAAAIVFPLLKLSDIQGGLLRLAMLLTVASPLLPTAFLPLTVLSGSAAALGRGCIFKTGAAIRDFADADLMMLDHQSLLAAQELEVVELRTANGVEPEHLLLQAVSLANGWDTPVGMAIRAYGGKLHPLTTEQHLYSEHGTAGQIGGHDVYCGDAAFCTEMNVRPALFPTDLEENVLYLVRDGVYLGCFLLGGKVPQENLGIARTMHEVGVTDTVLVSEADPAAVKQASDPCGIITWHAKQTPRSAAGILRGLQEQGAQGCFVGNWETQGPAMSEAAVSVSVGLDESLFQVPPDMMMTHRNLRLLAETKLLSVEMIHRLRLLFWLTLAGRGILILLTLIGLLPAWLPLLAEVLLSVGAVFYGGRLSDRKIKL